MKNFKRKAQIYKILALADMDNGVPVSFFLSKKGEMETKENYEACQGIMDEIQKVSIENGLNKKIE